MTTGLGICTKALQKIGVLVKSETLDSDEANDALDALNALVSSWANDSMTAYQRTEENFPLVAGTSTYTIGTGQTFNTSRPVYITSAFIRSTGNIDYPLAPISDENYARVSMKSTQGIPEFYNYTNGYPYGTIKIYQVPNLAYTLYINSEKPLTSFTLAGNVSLPPGWERALIANLAVELAPDYGEAVSGEALGVISQIARESKGAIKTAIMKSRSMDAYPLTARLPTASSNWDGI